MGKLQLYKIELDDIRGVYKPGQNVTGRLIIELDEGITVRGISIYTLTNEDNILCVTKLIQVMFSRLSISYNYRYLPYRQVVLGGF